MEKYFDPLYGEIELEEIILDLVRKCPELKRLRYIGMMNFKSLNMLPLTTITRLEHTIGLSYLSQSFSKSNSLALKEKNELVVASLFHDVNCGSFGHSIEWAIDRFKPYNHETTTEWLTDNQTSLFLDKKPIFIEQYGINRLNFDKEYHVDLKRVFRIINGKDSFFINNSGIDLDNIDNVFRMGLYMGLVKDKTVPATLSRCLKTRNDYNNFIVNQENQGLIKTWHDLRSEIYKKFIYSSEYLGYEYLLFKLISEFAKNVEPEGVTNLIHYTDEHLLWRLYEDKKLSSDINNVARMLLLHDIPQAYSIIRSSDFDKKKKITKADILESVANDVLNELRKSKIVSSAHPFELFYHVTTDDRKTQRQVDFFVESTSGEITHKAIGDNARYLVIGILGKKTLQNKAIDFITEKTIETLRQYDLGSFEKISLSAQRELL